MAKDLKRDVVAVSGGAEGYQAIGGGNRVNKRQEKLLALLQEEGEVDVTALVHRLNASEATIRRDLTALGAAKKVIRTFGGAKIAMPASLVVRTFEQKRESMRPEKERFARKVAEGIRPGMVLAIDSGTTTWRVAMALKDKSPLVILTSALAVLEELGSVEGMQIHLVGGRFRLENLDFAGPTAVAAFKTFRADLGILGADSLLPGRGAFALDESSAALARAIGQCADKRILVLDHSKIGAKGHCQTFRPEEIDSVVTDAGLPEDVKQLLEREPYELIQA